MRGFFRYIIVMTGSFLFSSVILAADEQHQAVTVIHGTTIEQIKPPPDDHIIVLHGTQIEDIDPNADWHTPKPEKDQGK